MRGDKWTKNAQTSKHGAGYVDILFELRLLLSGHKMYKSVDNQSVGNKYNQQFHLSSVGRADCAPLWAYPAPPPLLDISICPEVMMRSNNGRGEEATVSREGVRSRGSELIERAEAAAPHGGFQPTPSWARMKHYNYG